ncbi:hypothetical protein, partial [Burkholderia sp. Ap-962]|uniref:hypothetical protein n=1 Tax=Burkholderia sp. Ap-962 TaxID=2608333 RepID=UPI001962B8AD
MPQFFSGPPRGRHGPRGDSRIERTTARRLRGKRVVDGKWVAGLSLACARLAARAGKDRRAAGQATPARRRYRARAGCDWRLVAAYELDPA